MEKYNPEAKCPKCTSTDISDRYRKRAPKSYNTSYEAPEGEYVERICRSCAFEWPESCADAELSYQNGCIDSSRIEDNPATPIVNNILNVQGNTKMVWEDVWAKRNDLELSYDYKCPNCDNLDRLYIGANQIEKAKSSEGHKTHCWKCEANFILRIRNAEPEKEELQIVYINKVGMQYEAFCPDCSTYLNTFFLSVNEKEDIESRLKCARCLKEFIFYIRLTAPQQKELPVVWVDDKEKANGWDCFEAACPYCGKIKKAFNYDSEAYKEARFKNGYDDVFCHSCSKQFIICIRPEKELPVVWAEENEKKGYCVKCPSCNAYDCLFSKGDNFELRVIKEQGCIEKCGYCGEKYIIRIRPDDPAEEYSEGSKWFSVQWWNRYDPCIIEVEIKDKGIHNCQNDYQTPLRDYLQGTIGKSNKHYSLHRTHAEALEVAAPLWERDGTKLWGIERFNNNIFHRKIKNGKLCHPAPGMALPHNSEDRLEEYIYLGPDHDLAQKICREKNAKLKSEVDDSVLDKGIEIVFIAKLLTNYKGCFDELIRGMYWYWGHLLRKEISPSWNQLLRRSPKWAQWVVDNLADEIDSEIIAALKARLEK